MSSNWPQADSNKSQVHFAANLNERSGRGSEYMNTNFQLLQQGREVQINDPDYDTGTGTNRLKFDDYYAGLKANEENTELKDGNIFIKGNFRSDMQTFILHCVLLLVAIICGSSVGVFYYYIQPTNQLLKASWRMLFLAICVCPLAVMEYQKGKERFIYSKEALFNREVLKKMLYASLGHVVWTVALVIAVNHTSMAQANLLISLHPITLLVARMNNRSGIIGTQKIGAICVAIGVLLVFFDESTTSFTVYPDLNQVTSSQRIIYGNIVALLGSVGGAFYFTKNHELKTEYPFFLGILMISVLGFTMISILSIILEGTSISFDSNTGIFGLFTGEWFGVYILTIIFTGFGTYIGYVVSFKYFEPLLLSIIQNTEPIFAALLVAVLGWQSMPSFLTSFAFILIIPGLILVTLGNREGEVREYDIMNESLFPGSLISEQKLPRTMSVLKNRQSSVVAPISWEK